MKLSDAILLGSTLKPQGFGTWFLDGASCAGGAALDAIGQPEKSLTDTWRWIYFTDLSYCHECEHVDCFLGIMFHLNDIHKWTRERIAIDFVRPLEEKYDNQQASTENCNQPAHQSFSRPAPSGEDSGPIEVTPEAVGALMEVA